MRFFRSVEVALGRIIPDHTVDATLEMSFSRVSFIIHAIWFALWFKYGLDVSLLTNIVSLEAIFLAVLIGIQQASHHDEVSDHLTTIKGDN